MANNILQEKFLNYIKSQVSFWLLNMACVSFNTIYEYFDAFLIIILKYWSLDAQAEIQLKQVFILFLK